MSVNKTATTVTIGYSESQLDRRERLLSERTKRVKPVSTSQGISVHASLWDYYTEKYGV